MLALEIGPGNNKTYPFAPATPINYNVIFADIDTPTEELKKFEWILLDASHPLPFRDETFDLVVARHVIEHLDNIQLFISECYRILKKNGMLEIITPNFLSRDTRNDPTHKHALNIITLAKTLQNAGFEIQLQVTAASMIPYPFRIIIHVLLNMLCDHIYIRGVKI